MKLLDLVILKIDLPEHDLKKELKILLFIYSRTKKALKLNFQS